VSTTRIGASNAFGAATGGVGNTSVLHQLQNSVIFPQATAPKLNQPGRFSFECRYSPPGLEAKAAEPVQDASFR
jgi:hypothetical protein